MKQVLMLEKVDPYHLGFIPQWLMEEDPRPAKIQLDEKYRYGGGWQPFSGFKMNPKTYGLTYPDDPEMHPFAAIFFREEIILMYPHSWVAILQPDETFEVCRMD